MDRRTVDEDLDDLTLDAGLETDGDDRAVDADTTASGVMAPPPKRTVTRKPPARKTSTAPSGNGKSNGRTATNESNGGAKPKIEDSEDTAIKADDLGDPPEPETAEAAKPGGSEAVAEAAASDETVVAEAVVAEAVVAEEPASKAPVRETQDTGEQASPAMPADDIWKPRSVGAGSGGTSNWTPAEDSARPRGNAFEVNDAFSAPPMPSDSGPSASRSFASATSTSSSSSASTSTSTSSAPPTRAFPRSGSATRAGAKPSSAGAPRATVRRQSAGRQAHLTIARVEPWSVMKFSFAVSVISFVVLFVAVAVLYGVLSALGVFDSLQHLVNSMTSSQSSSGYNIRKWLSASRILGYTALLGCLNIVLITAMSTIGAVIYNLTSRLIGGVEVTLKETD